MKNWLFCLSVLAACATGEKPMPPTEETDTRMAKPNSQSMPDAVESAPLEQPDSVARELELESPVHGSADQSQVDSIKAAKARLKKRKGE